MPIFYSWFLYIHIFSIKIQCKNNKPPILSFERPTQTKAATNWLINKNKKKFSSLYTVEMLKLGKLF